eukprot:5140734-Prymnesium_polylepis.2
MHDVGSDRREQVVEGSVDRAGGVVAALQLDARVPQQLPLGNVGIPQRRRRDCHRVGVGGDGRRLGLLALEGRGERCDKVDSARQRKRARGRHRRGNAHGGAPSRDRRVARGVAGGEDDAVVPHGEVDVGRVDVRRRQPSAQLDAFCGAVQAGKLHDQQALARAAPVGVPALLDGGAVWTDGAPQVASAPEVERRARAREAAGVLDREGKRRADRGAVGRVVACRRAVEHACQKHGRTVHLEAEITIAHGGLEVVGDLRVVRRPEQLGARRGRRPIGGQAAGAGERRRHQTGCRHHVGLH